MFKMDNGALFIDTPGIRELALFDYNGLGGSFRDIEDLAQNCKFKDCLHVNEPGCAVRKAIRSGVLEEKRLESYEKMKREEKGYRSRQILLNKKVSKAKIKRSNVHYKDYVRGGDKTSWNY
jgi:ribosome biogenesis GTPase